MFQAARLTQDLDTQAPQVVRKRRHDQLPHWAPGSGGTGQGAAGVHSAQRG
jgi:hypothetical protein